MSTIAGLAAAALASLSPADIAFLDSLPKAELHAHLNGSIPVATLLQLVSSHPPDDPSLPSDILAHIERLQSGVPLTKINDFFSLFPAIYALTSTPNALATATRAVIEAFLCAQPDRDAIPQCQYLELRTTPRCTPHMSRQAYLSVVLDEIEKFPAAAASLIVSIDRRMSESDVKECVDLAIQLRKGGRRVVGLDLCGDPTKGEVETFEGHFRRGKDAGLGVTLHIAELSSNLASESLALLNWRPDRLGHATFLSDDAKAQFFSDVPQSEATPAAASADYTSPAHPLQAAFLAEYHLQLVRLQEDNTESAEAKMMLSYHFDMDKTARRAAGRIIREREEAERRKKYKPCIEICLTSNLLCKTVPSLDEHHIRYYLKNDHPVAICTDDTLPFRTSLIAEYALLLAERPLGLGLSRTEVARVAQMAMDARFTV
ncbi:Metallo-dependent hydrolase [Leucogyrophana mollusca]|uniref:Metallo-dependent hydrolase n=1 Tax=Leucogyrophana mollusca TaxID=85980 RepID=A0ACB8BIJ7_9AGAM|nr:Metallo-dependent hydrolase [Leucogyrophana mollusca]